MTVAGAPATGQAVTYAGLVESGGTPPVTTSCLPASGSTFPVGATPVNCSARDAINRSAVCSFTVTLTSSHLAAMHFLAFGDSTTAGENGIDFQGDPYPEIYTPPTCGTTSLTSTARSLQYFDPTTSYPQQLLNLLKAQFPGESFVMENEGNPGEAAVTTTQAPTQGGEQRLSTCFMTDHPNVMLLLEGINDIAGAATPYQPTASEKGAIISALRADVTAAIANGVSYIFVSTILPVANCQSEPCRGADPNDPTRTLAIANASINSVNAMIRSQVGGATIVDANAAFFANDPTLATLIDVDGLHPLPMGYTVLAKTFLSGITTKVPITSVRRRR